MYPVRTWRGLTSRCSWRAAESWSRAFARDVIPLGRSQLNADVDMTSAVKSHQDGRVAGAVRCSGRTVPLHGYVSSHRQRRSLYTRRSIMLISVGWVPPYWCPSRRLLRS